MTIPAYPSELPRPLADPYQLARGDGRVQMRNDAGPPSTRRRFSSVVDIVQFSTFLDRSELARFDRFYYEDTKKGTIPFTIPDPGTDGWPLLTEGGVPILNESDVPILLSETWLVTFGGKLPAITTRGVNWTVAFELLVLPQ